MTKPHDWRSYDSQCGADADGERAKTGDSSRQYPAAPIKRFHLVSAGQQTISTQNRNREAARESLLALTVLPCRTTTQASEESSSMANAPAGSWWR